MIMVEYKQVKQEGEIAVRKVRITVMPSTFIFAPH